MIQSAAWLILAQGALGSAWMLLWGAAAVLPLLLHLWHRNRHEEAPWAAMEFLLAAVQQQTRRIRLEQFLLLVLRMAIPLVLALALADPLWQWSASLGTSVRSRPARHHLLILDGSYSMGYRVNGQTRLARAQELVRETVQDSHQGDGFTMLLMAEPAEVIVATPVFDPQDILAEVTRLRLRDAGADLPATLDLAKEVLQNVRAEHPRLVEQRVYFFSDLGANTWRAATQPAVGERIGELESLAEIITVDVGSQGAANAGISHVSRDEPVATIADPVHWSVTVTRFAGSPSAELAVEMFVDGQRIARQGIELPAGEQANARFAYRFDTTGQHRIEFRLTDDALPIDNYRYEVLTVRSALQVLCISGKAGAARNVAIALAPSPAHEAVQVRIVADHRLPELNLAEFDCIFFCNAGRFTREDVSKLKSFLSQGRGVVIFLGDRVQPDNYNQLLAGDEPMAILPARIGPLAPPGSYLVNPQDYQHPIIRPFRGQQRTGLLTTPIWRYYRLAVPTDAAPRVALQLTNGDPLILEHSVGRGRVILVATAPSEKSVSRQGGRLRPWTAWTAWPSFPPLVQEMLALSASAGDEGRNVIVGQALGGALLSEFTTQYVTISRREQESATSHRVPVVQNEVPASWSFDQTYRSGFYFARSTEGGAEQGETAFAVNLVADEESRLERMPREKLPSPFQRHTVAVKPGSASGVAASSEALFRIVLGCLLVLLFVESLVAWTLGNARA